MREELSTFEFAGQDVRTVTIAGEPWFHIGDVCAILEIQNPRDVVAKNLKKNDVAKIYVTIGDGRRRQVWFTNEPGVYRLILRSHKPEAERFQDWLCREVLPSIRKTGRFSIDVPFLIPTCKPWTKAFEDDFYSHVFRLKGIAPVPKERAPWLAQVTNDLIYQRLDEGIFEALQLLNPIPNGKRWRRHKHHQHITPGDPEKRFIDLMGQCRGMMAAFFDWNEFHSAWNRTHPLKRQLPHGIELKLADSQTLLFPFMLDEALIQGAN